MTKLKEIVERNHERKRCLTQEPSAYDCGYAGEIIRKAFSDVSRARLSIEQSHAVSTAKVALKLHKSKQEMLTTASSDVDALLVEIERLTGLSVSLDNLLCCYRTGRRPSEKLLRDIAKFRATNQAGE